MLRKLLTVSHWTQKIRETTVSRDGQGVLNLRVLGGAEYGQLIYLGQAQEGKPHYPGGRVQAGDLLLEVNEAPVSGLTLRDTLAMLGNATEPIRIKTVPQGSQLNRDVRHYLKQSFSKGSADLELQERIRQNLYIRAVPCTTRAPREDEIPGVDYHFITLSEFQALERAGGLLESGKFHGNYYGTPVPPIVPANSSRGRLLTTTPDPLGPRWPQRSKSLHNLEKGSREVEGESSGDSWLEGTSRPTGSTANVSPGEPAPVGTNRSPALGGNGISALETRTEGHRTEAGTLPENRELTPNTTGESHQSKQTPWQQADVSAPKGKDGLFPTDVSHMLGHSVITTITKTNNTFGFTIAGGNKPNELLQIVSLATGGPAERSGEMAIHDVVVAIDKTSVLGSTHSEVVCLFQAVAEGDGAELQLRRGYPALYNVEPRLLSEVNAPAPLPSPAPLALLPVALMQSSDGPGFAVEERGSGGGGYARVQRIWDQRRCPCLAVGDLIVKVNGQRVRALSDERLAEVLRTHAQAGDVVLLVQRAVEGPAIGAQLSPDSIRCSADGSARPQAGYTERGDGDGQPSRTACQRTHDPEAPWSDGPARRDGGKPPEAIAHWRGDEGSGLVAVSVDKASPATSIIPRSFTQMARSGPVDHCEMPRAGDRAEALNGQPPWVKDADPSSKAHLALRERNGATCKTDAREGDRCSWSRPAHLDDPRASSRAKMRGFHPDQDSELYSVELERSPTGFGFSVRGGREYEMDLYVLGLIVGGPAMRSGKIKIGDQLLEINGEWTLGITHSRAVELIKEGREKIRLLMRRGDGRVPEYPPDPAGERERGAAAERPVRQQQHQPDSLITTGRRTELQSHPRRTQAHPAPEPEAQARPEPESEAQSWVASSPDPASPRKRGRLDEGSEGRARGSRPPGATWEGGDPDSGPTADGSRGCGPTGSRGRDYKWPRALLDHSGPRALLDHSGPRALLDHSGPRAAESSETESSGSGASDRSPPGEDSSPLSSFDEQRLLSSMVGRLLDGPLPPGQPGAKGTEAGGYCVHCGGQKARGSLTPGPWIVPKRERLLEIMDGSWSS